MLDELKIIFQEYSILISIIGILIPIIGLLISYRRNLTLKKSYRLAKSSQDKNNSKFNIYLESSNRITSKIKHVSKILLFNVRINNLSSSKNTFTASLEVVYHNDEKNTKSKIIIDHDPQLKKKTPQEDLTVFGNKIRLEESDIKIGWLLFQQNTFLNGKRIEKYIITIKDVQGNFASVETYLIKDIWL